MILAFILTMPGRASWNGRWSGDESFHALVRSFPRGKEQQAEELVRLKGFSYDFGDGWRAQIRVQPVDRTEARTLLRRSRGFYGYDWMVDSIINDGDIYGPMKPKPVAA